MSPYAKPSKPAVNLKILVFKLRKRSFFFVKYINHFVAIVDITSYQSATLNKGLSCNQLKVLQSLFKLTLQELKATSLIGGIFITL